MPKRRPIASFARTTVFCADKTMTGTGKYCSAAKDAMVADGSARCIDMESLRIELGDSDLARSPMAKYPPSRLSASVIMITVVWWCACMAV